MITKGGIVVTGASSGIGHHAAVSLAQAGFFVYAGVRKQEDADAIEAQGIPGLRAVILDVTKQHTIDTAVATVTASLTKEKLPMVGLVNNAGIARTFPVELLDMDDVRANFEVNYFGVIAVTQAFLPLLRATGDGARLIQISSVAGFISSAGGNPYAATKFAMEALGDALRLELAPWRISVSTINPAFVSTPILGRPGDKGADSKAKQLAKLSAEKRELYSHLFTEESARAEQEFYARADSPQVTTDAIVHAITSPHPQVRYIVANVGGVPAWVYCYLRWYLPERLLDAIILNAQHIDN